ncbi:MAG: DNA polymerase I [Christensenellaceae bacterium]|nr:DNA polymerase I [Christensenellaceae bacterium]
MTKLDSKVLLVDGNSLLYRAFFALPPLSSNGIPVNAVHGFFSMLFKAISENKPSSVFVMMDESGPTFRHEEYTEYKADRPPTPDDLKSQFGLMRELLTVMHIPVISQPGFEADDLLGSAAHIANNNNIPAIILTGDRDALQLVNDKTQVLITKKGISESLLLNPQGVKDNYGVDPGQITDLKGLMGDKSDNIPGVPGVGEKTALKLLGEYGNIENVLNNAHNIKGKLGERLQENKQIAIFSKKLATIICTVPLDIDFSHQNISLIPNGINELKKYNLNRVIQTIQGLFSNDGVYGHLDVTMPEIKLDIKSKAKPIQEDVGNWALVKKDFLGKREILPNAMPKEESNIVINDEESLQKFTNAIEEGSFLALYFSPNFDRINLYTQNGVYADVGIKLDMISEGLPFDVAFSIIVGSIANTKLILHGQKNFLNECSKFNLPILKNCVWDTMIAAYILQSNLNQVSLEKLVLPQEANAKALYALALEQFSNINSQSMLRLVESMEFPLSRVLHSMEQLGFLIDRDVLMDLSKQFTREIEFCKDEVYRLTGFNDFNLNSPKQLQEVLFEKLGLPPGKKTKSGYSTDAETLENLEGLHPAIEPLLKYRKFSKLNSTYIDALIRLTNKTPRVHTSFDQTGTVTGRISSLEPNLQNIPIKTKEGAEIRRAFIAKEGHVLLDADYSQIELRVLAHLSDDEAMIDAFCSNEDIHARTASEIFDVPLNMVTGEMRSNAKAVNFGLIYGISTFGLARNTKISIKQAEYFMSKYFEHYPGVRVFMDKCVEEGTKNRAIYTLFNRKRELPELSHKNANIRAFGKRVAMNTPVQGTAADIIKLAMVSVYNILQNDYPMAQLILQVHDELIVECPENMADELSKLIKNTMENIVKLKVPLVADVGVGKSWFDAK